MSNAIELETTIREDMGKGASRRLRRLENRIPAVLYGAGEDVATLSLAHHKVVKAMENPAFFSSLISLKVDGKNQTVVLKDLQRHPFKPLILHMDFLRTSAKEKLTITVPLHFINEDIAPGVKVGGGIISHITTEVEVSCLPKDLPEFIELDMGAVELNQTVHLSDLVMPKGVELTAFMHEADNNQPVVSIHLARAAKEETVEEEAAPDEDAAKEEDADKKD